MPVKTETRWDLIVSNDELDIAAIPRAKEYIEKRVSNSERNFYLNNGYTIKKEGINKSTLIKAKKPYDAFEDEVWTIFYKMGFKHMNKDNSFSILYSPENNLSKQIDVVAIDDETCLLIECKESNRYGTNRNFQQDINEVPSFFKKVCNVICNRFPNVKCKYIFATKNYTVSQQDKNRMKEHGIIYFDYSAILYYKALVNHLGKAAKYQLLGQIFSGQKISGMDMKIPAIKGKMGGLTYYSFVMTPEKLLKIGYVLHKTNANNDYDSLLPSYQRLIKKERLANVKKFINEGNFFPNSIIISIDSKNPLIFNQAPQQFNQDSLAKIGLLTLPQIYQSAYIIDGQHRLYGYSDSQYASNNSIPIVAFENLDKRKQLKLFMEINQNQKAVPKALRNILEIEINYESNDRVLAQSALLGKIAKKLGEDSNSPLKDRVVIGEDAGTKRCCITIENIKLALNKTCFFNNIKKNGNIVSHGLFDDDNNPSTLNKVYPIIVKYLSKIRDEFKDDWSMDDSFYVKNNIIGAYIRILSDMISINYEKDQTCISDENILFERCDNYIVTLLTVLHSLSPEERARIVNEKGAVAQTKVYRDYIQMKMFELNSSFTNNDIETYYVEKYKNYNIEAEPLISKIKKMLISFSKEKFEKNSKKWMREILSEQHENELTSKVNNKNNSNERKGIYTTVTEWDVIEFSDFKRIMSTGSNWTNYYKDFFISLDSSYTKDKILSLIDTIISSDGKIKNGHKITGTDFVQINDFCKKMEGKQ